MVGSHNTGLYCPIVYFTLNRNPAIIAVLNTDGKCVGQASYFSKHWRLRLHRSFHGACLPDHRVNVLLHVLVRCPERVELLNLFQMLFGDFRSGVDFRNRVEP